MMSLIVFHHVAIIILINKTIIKLIEFFYYLDTQIVLIIK